MSLTDTTAFATEDPVCFLATTDADPPHVRGWLFWFAHDTGFYFQTLAPKDVDPVRAGPARALEPDEHDTGANCQERPSSLRSSNVKRRRTCHETVQSTSAACWAPRYAHYDERCILIPGPGAPGRPFRPSAGVCFTTAVSRDVGPPAGRWQRDNAESWFVERCAASESLHDDLASFAEAVGRLTGAYASTSQGARDVLTHLLACLSRCDDLTFDEPAQCVAYSIWHLVDRYARVQQALDVLVRNGRLPMRRERLAVLEVGSGPSPAIYAAMDYYTRFGRWAAARPHPFPTVAPSSLHMIERGAAWSPFVHRLSEELLITRFTEEAPPSGPLPFAVTYGELSGFSVRDEHDRDLKRRTRAAISEADSWDEILNLSDARAQTESDPERAPSAYDLIVVCNFLTSQSLAARFETELRWLARSLTPGGVLLVLGSAHSAYETIYRQVRSLASSAGLRTIPDADSPLQAHPCDEVRQLVAGKIVESLQSLRRSAPQEYAAIADDLPGDVQPLEAARVDFPAFRVCAFVNQSPPRRGRDRSRRRL